MADSTDGADAVLLRILGGRPYRRSVVLDLAALWLEVATVFSPVVHRGFLYSNDAQPGWRVTPAPLRIAMKEKSEHNPCPVCGLPRGKGPHEFAHGKCMEQRAKTDGKELQFPGDKQFGRLTKDHQERSQRKASANKYLSGNLPKWMYD